MPPSGQVKGVRDTGGGQGQESRHLCASAGGRLQPPAGFPTPAEEGRRLQSGCKSKRQQ